MKFFKLDNGRYLGFDDNIPDSIMKVVPELIKYEILDTSYGRTYSQEEYDLVIHPPVPTWENTLTSHQEGSTYSDLTQLVYQLGYVYFVWNGHIYRVTNYHQNLTYELVEDFNETDIK